VLPQQVAEMTLAQAWWQKPLRRQTADDENGVSKIAAQAREALCSIPEALA